MAHGAAGNASIRPVHDDHRFDEQQRTAVEEIVGRDLDEESSIGKPLSSRARQTQRSVESYRRPVLGPAWVLEHFSIAPRSGVRRRG